MSPAAPRLLIVVLSMANFVIGLGAFLMIGILTPVAADLGLPPARIGWTMTTYALAYAVLSPLLVSFTGQIGRRRVLTFALALFSAANLLSAFAPNEFSLHLARVIAAAGAGVLTPVAASVAAGLSDDASRGRVLAAVFFGLTLAQVLGVPAGSWIAYTFGWRMAFVIAALLGLPIMLLLWRTIPAGLRFQPVTLSDLAAVLKSGNKVLAVMFTTTFLSGSYVVYTYMAPLLESGMGFGRDGVALALFLFGIGAVGGNILGGWMADRIGPFPSLLALAVTQMLVLPVFSFLPLPVFWLFVLAVVWSLSVWSFMASQQLRLITISPRNAQIMLALNAAAIYIGAALGSALGSLVIAGYGLAGLGLAGSIVAASAVLHLLVSERMNRRSVDL